MACRDGFDDVMEAPCDAAAFVDCCSGVFLIRSASGFVVVLLYGDDGCICGLCDSIR